MGKFKVIRDNREQTPWIFPPDIEVIDGTLSTGDYTIKGLESWICIERKEFSDFIACCGTGRDRFIRELDRMRAFPWKVVVIEGRYSDCVKGNYRSKIAPQSVTGSIASWTGKFGVSFMFVENSKDAADFAMQMMNSLVKSMHDVTKAINLK